MVPETPANKMPDVEKQDVEKHKVKKPGTLDVPLQPETVFSLKWLVAGIVALLLFGGGVVGLYFYQIRNLPTYIIEAADRLERAGKRKDAAKLLDGFRRNNPQEDTIYRRLDELNQKILIEEGRTSTQYATAIRVSQELKKRSSKQERLAIGERILNWEWDQRNYEQAMEEARDMFRLAAELGVDDREIASAWKIYTIGTILRLNEIDYRAADIPEANLPDSVDKLLQRAYALNPSDVELAILYARFLRGYSNDAYTRNSSEALVGETREARDKQADRIVDDMVDRNRNDTAAYLTRYQYRREFGLIDPQPQALDADLKKAVEVDPKNIAAQVLAGLFEIALSNRAREEGDEEAYKAHRAAAEHHFQEIGKRNEQSEIGFQFLGDLSLSEGRLAQGTEWYRKGVDRIRNRVAPEIESRFILALNDQGKFEEATAELARFNKYFRDPQIRLPKLELERMLQLIELLRARVYATEGSTVSLQSERLRANGDTAGAQKAMKEGQLKINESIQILVPILNPFGRSASDYIIPRDSIYYRVLGESLMLLGRLMGSQAKWDQAAEYYEKAAAFSGQQERAYLEAATALQQQNQTQKALTLLMEAMTRNPESEAIRFMYTKALFRNEMSMDAAGRSFREVETELNRLEANKASLPQPWAVDLLRIQIQYARDSISGDTDRVLAAQQVALRQYRELERKTFPAPAVSISGEEQTEPKRFDQDIEFLSSLASIYSAMSAVHDFERITMAMRELPEGEAAYYAERAGDALRRSDREGAMDILTQAIDSDLSNEQKQRFSTLLDQIRSTDPNSSTAAEVYDQLNKSFMEDPDSLQPAALFILANGALDREDWKAAVVYEEKLRHSADGDEFGTFWRYVKARRLLIEDMDAPNIAEAKKLQEEIVRQRPQWDMAFVLAALIEEKTPLSEGITGSLKRSREIEFYKQAIKYGNATPGVWEALINLLIEEKRVDEAADYQRNAVLQSIPLQSSAGRFPMPYQRYYTEVFKAIGANDFEEADRQAKTCILLAQKKREVSDLIFDLNMAFGKMFLDAGYTNLAEKYLRAVHVRGGIYVYPLAVCMAKAGQVDEGFHLILDEIDRTPSSIGSLIPPLLVLIEQVRPSEEVFERIDELMTRIETGERLVFEGTLERGQNVDLGEMRVHSIILRFPGQTIVPDPSTIRILAPQTDEAVLDGISEGVENEPLNNELMDELTDESTDELPDNGSDAVRPVPPDRPVENQDEEPVEPTPLTLEETLTDEELPEE